MEHAQACECLGSALGRRPIPALDAATSKAVDAGLTYFTLKVNVLPADVAEAVLFFASPRRVAKSTGNILNVDGGVALAYSQ